MKKRLPVHPISRPRAGQFRRILSVLMVLLSIAGHGQNGRVGINTVTPLAGLHVADSSVLFVGQYPVNGQGTHTVPVSGQGTRFMWVPEIGALRAGSVAGAQWNKDSTARHSVAMGFNTVASSQASLAMGLGARAAGQRALAIGSGVHANGFAAAAFGNTTLASGDNSFAAGTGSQATSTNAFAAGNLAKAKNTNSFAIGNFTTSDGISSAAFGTFSITRGTNSVSMGLHSVAGAYASFVAGRYNDSTTLYGVLSENNWYPEDPLFVIGNGTSHTNRKNALVMTKNGNLGLNTNTPSFRLQVSNANGADGGYAEGILVENTSSDVGEAAINFRNTSIPSDRQWTIGLDQNPNLAFHYGPGFTTGNTHMLIDTTGRVGINTVTPQAMLHVVRNNPSGGVFNANALAVFESNNIAYLQLLSESADESGILSGNQATSIRSALIFRADSSVQVRTGGNNTRIHVDTDGNVGIGTTAPTARLQVNGTVKLGTNGSVLNEVIKATVNANLPSVAAGATLTQTFSVTNAVTTGAVGVSQAGSFNDGFIIASARVSAANTVEVRFVNTSGTAYDPPAMDFHFTIIR